MAGFNTDKTGKQEASPGHPGQDKLAARLGALARDLQQGEDTDAVLSGIVHAALELVPHAAHASVSLVTRHRTIESRVASSDLPRRVDALQSKTGQGPCLDASYDERIVRVPNLGTDKRWPEFSQPAFDLGAKSMLSVQLFVDGDHLGALNLFADDIDVFDTESEQIGTLVAAHAAVALAGSQQISQLIEALDTRDLIGQAKGILMERFKITAQEAFLLLVRASSELNLKLRNVAEQLAATGEMAQKNGR